MENRARFPDGIRRIVLGFGRRCRGGNEILCRDVILGDFEHRLSSVFLDYQSDFEPPPAGRRIGTGSQSRATCSLDTPIGGADMPIGLPIRRTFTRTVSHSTDDAPTLCGSPAPVSRSAPRVTNPARACASATVLQTLPQIGSRIVRSVSHCFPVLGAFRLALVPSYRLRQL